jgi:8-oxo-dGTP diphosphatase
MKLNKKDINKSSGHVIICFRDQKCFSECHNRYFSGTGGTMIVTCAVIKQNGLYMICRRAEGQTLAGYWEFPGGKLEEGETIEECLERELFEELGIRTRASQVIAVTDIPHSGKNYRLMALQTELLGGKLELTVHDAI